MVRRDSENCHLNLSLSAVCDCGISRQMAENGFAPPLGNFADISYLVEN